jgi:hypothetical protein
LSFTACTACTTSYVRGASTFPTAGFTCPWSESCCHRHFLDYSESCCPRHFWIFQSFLARHPFPAGHFQLSHLVSPVFYLSRAPLLQPSLHGNNSNLCYPALPWFFLSAPFGSQPLPLPVVPCSSRLCTGNSTILGGPSFFCPLSLPFITLVSDRNGDHRKPSRTQP